ncbi:ATP-grasp domain-containing protein [Mesorhizobium sp. M1A.F.Ca.ET.072.01.1.1]|uniref:ATP-grasp domain-containing protein n=1 Tax=Mesorhizobium sp. M1A.F.Ca.ET.072.01.1.1 TaxID=2496753 RepID=UPI000FD60434|nr:acetyl-CoA carboxylase biotin carboxylase subunit family protein [Mesorhizobium sp. M1A.F.Ca.ET.072.01.1.1]RUW47951.1 ATP-grasp domain-containing protein [Mesorhizobium sp. M1A.F.Ca.ET.072.01.1.1]TIV04762.1 MAG: ATP-grasp domain-containing protein [Mesorhizobium sp.]
MTKRALILVEGHRGLGLPYVKTAQRLGLHPITLSADPTQYDYLLAEGIEAIRIDTDNLDALIHECARVSATYAISGITGFSGADDSACVTAAELCRHFDLPGPNPASIERCCDKFTQRELLAKAGVQIPAYRLAWNATDVERAASEIGLPVVLKPAVGSGSSGVQLCRNFDELDEHTAYLFGGKHIWRSLPRILVEEFVQGPQYGAEIMGNEVVGIAPADFGPPPHFVFHGVSFPAPLTDEEHKRIADLSLICLRALDLGWGPTNVEFRWTTRGPVVIEVNPRIPGTPTPQLVQLAYGIDLVAEHIKLIIGEEWDLRRRHSHTVAARFLVPDRDGILETINGDRAATVEGIVEVKLYAEPMRPIVRKGDYRDPIGHVIAVSPSFAQTETILQDAVDLIDWSIKPFPTASE